MLNKNDDMNRYIRECESFKIKQNLLIKIPLLVLVIGLFVIDLKMDLGGFLLGILVLVILFSPFAIAVALDSFAKNRENRLDINVSDKIKINSIVKELYQKKNIHEKNGVESISRYVINKELYLYGDNISVKTSKDSNCYVEFVSFKQNKILRLLSLSNSMYNDKFLEQKAILYFPEEFMKNEFDSVENIESDVEEKIKSMDFVLSKFPIRLSSYVYNQNYYDVKILDIY